MSYHVTLLIQGVGSGFDVAAATFGGSLYYVKGGVKMELLPLSHLPIVVGYSGIKADTPLYIRKVAEAFKQRKGEMDILFQSISDLVEKAKISLLKEDFEKVGTLFTENHSILKKLGVSIPKLDDMVEASISAGAWGAKLSGAGGGDCMIALVSDSKREGVEKAIRKMGGEIIPVTVNAPGVERDNI